MHLWSAKRRAGLFLSHLSVTMPSMSWWDVKQACRSHVSVALFAETRHAAVLLMAVFSGIPPVPTSRLAPSALPAALIWCFPRELTHPSVCPNSAFLCLCVMYAHRPGLPSGANAVRREPSSALRHQQGDQRGQLLQAFRQGIFTCAHKLD